MLQRRLKMFPRIEKGWLEDVVRDRADAMSVVCDRVRAEVFLRFCIDATPRTASGRDTRRQRLIRTMRRMQERGDLPFVAEGEEFVFGTPCQQV
jgi:hypothetical protein